jgi:glycolate oxidase iron-sulfur subunit
VPFGHLVEATTQTLAARGRAGSRLRRVGYRVLGHHRLLRALSTVLAVAQRARVVPTRRLGLPARLPLRQPSLRSSGTDVWLFTGCVRDAWQRHIHAAAQQVVERTGAGVAISGTGAACCGALHEHAGFGADARQLAARTMAAMPGPAPVLVDSAGCGAMLKDYGRLLDTDDARAFSARVRDIHEWLAERMDRLPPSRAPRPRVAVQDPCHLRHVQRAHLPVRTVLGRYADIVELDDDGLCCGAGGAYSLMQPELAGAVRDRKVAAIARSGAPIVASANPGCALHLAAAGLDVRHPMEIVAAALAPSGRASDAIRGGRGGG